MVEALPTSYPTTIGRDGVFFLVQNVTQAKAAREFLGIDPEGLGLFDWLAQRNLQELEQWRNFWIETFTSIGLGDWTDFINTQFNTFKSKLEEPPEPPEEFPQDISRGPYSFQARDAEEVKQLREFLGLFPPGDDLDTFLGKRDLPGLNQWKDYWFSIFGPLGRNDLLTFIDGKFQEFASKLEPKPPEPPIESFLEKLIRIAKETVLKAITPKPTLIEKIYLLARGKQLTEQEFSSLRMSQADFLLNLDVYSRLFTGKNLEGSEEAFGKPTDYALMAIDLVSLALFFGTPGIPDEVAVKAGGKGLINWATQLSLKKASPEIIEKILKTGNYDIIMKAIRAEPEEWAKLMPKLSQETRNILFASMKKFSDPTAFKLASDAVKTFETARGLSLWEKAFGILPGKTKARKVVLTITTILGTIAGYITLAQFLAHTGREAIADAVGFAAIWTNIDNGNWEAAAKLLPAYEEAINSYERATSLTKIIPFISGIWEDAIKAIRIGFEAEKELIETELAKISGPTGRLIVTPTPSDSKVSIAGQIPTTGIFDKILPVGRYEIIVSKFGFISESRAANVQEGGLTESFITLEEDVDVVFPPEEVKGKLIISVVPEDAIISVAGEEQITTAGTYELTPGSYGVRAEKEGFEPLIRTAFVRSDQDTQVSFTLQKIILPEDPTPPLPPFLEDQATITISSTPTNADVYINGEYTFTKTPYTTLLDKGSYIIRVQKDGYFPMEIIAEVEEGEVANIPITLEPIPEDAPTQPPYIPYQPTYPQGFEQLFPPVQAPIFFSEPAAAAERELLVNIETTDAKPWKGRIYSIAFQDLSVPGSNPEVLTSDNEEELLLQFIQLFNQINPDKLVGFKLAFDHRFIFNKLMLHRIQSKKWADIDLKDVKQLLDQVKEEFVYFPDKTGKLDDYGKSLLGKGKYGTQENMLKRYLAKDFDYVKAFQENQINVTNGLYQLHRFSTSETSSAPIQAFNPALSNPETSLNTGNPISSSQKQCTNCLAFNPLDATACLVCGSTQFK